MSESGGPQNRRLLATTTGLTGEARLAMLRDAVDRRPAMAIAIFTAASLIWTLSYTIALSVYPDNNFAVHLAPHVGFLSVVLGLILFPARFSWFPMVLFAGLFLTTLFSPYMLALDANASRGLYYGGIAFTLNLGLAMVFGRMGARIAGGNSPLLRTGLSQIGLLFISVFLSCVVTACVAFALVDGGMSWLLSIADEGNQQNTMAKGLFVLFRGVNGGLAGLFMLAVCILPIARQDLRRVVAVAPVFVFASWMTIQETLDYPELVFSVVLLAFAIVSSPSATAVLGITGAVIFAMPTGTFIVTSMDIGSGALLAHGMSAALIALTALIIVQKVEAAHVQANLARGDQMREQAQTLAGVGRFRLDAAAGILMLDDAARTATGLPPEIALNELETLLDEPSNKALLSLTGTATNPTRQAQIMVPRGDCGGRCDIRFVGWDMELPNGSGGQIIDGYVTRVPCEDAAHGDGNWKSGALSWHEENAALTLEMSARLETTVGDLTESLETMADIPHGVDSMLKDSRWKLINGFNNLRLMLAPKITTSGHKVPVRPSEFLKQVRETQAATLLDSDFNVTVLPISGSDQTELLDELRLSHVLGELMRNSARHSGGSGVWLSHAKETDWQNQSWSIWIVEDDGRGLHTDHFNASDSTPGSDTSSGLGIRACRAAIETLGGTLRCLPGIRGGARVEIRLPFEPAPSDSVSENAQARMASVHWAVVTTSPEENPDWIHC